VSSPGKDGRMVEKYDAGTAAGVKSGNDEEADGRDPALERGRQGVERSAELFHTHNISDNVTQQHALTITQLSVILSE